MEKRRVVIIPASIQESAQTQRYLRVASYVRVSTDEEEQQNSYEAQYAYYRDKIMSNPEWTMAGIYADDGISGTRAEKREDFMAMIKDCKKGKIDMILTKSISRFARNTLDSIHYIRMLKAMGIAVVFEKENINTLKEDSEMILTILSAFAQSESESISRNVSWGKREAMRQGKVHFSYKKLYGFQKGENGEPEIIPAEGDIVREIYESFLSGSSLRSIADQLNDRQVPYLNGKSWSSENIRSILTNEKYCGDVVMQKTFVKDCISHKVVKNTGQLPMYRIENNHPGIVSRETFQAALAELARRSNLKSCDKNAVTGRAKYSGKYALTERLICGECGTMYRRVTWKKGNDVKIVWRCISRLNYGKKYCHNSPTIYEDVLQQAILDAINSTMCDKQIMVDDIAEAMEKELTPDTGDMSLGDIERRLQELEQNFETLLEKASEDFNSSIDDYADSFAAVSREQADLKKRREVILAATYNGEKATQRIQRAKGAISSMNQKITQWDESMIRQLVEMVTAVSEEQIVVYFTDGKSVRQTVHSK